MHWTNELIFIFIYLSGRLFFYDLNNIFGPDKRRGFVKRLFYGLLIFLFSDNLIIAFIIFLLHAIAVLFDSFAIGKTKRDKSFSYFFHLFCGLFLIPLISKLIGTDFILLFNPLNHTLLFLIEQLKMDIFLTYTEIRRLLAIVCGFIFTIKEGTIIIRLILAKMSAIPKKKDAPRQKDTKEYDRGKLIGILERALIYFLIIVNQVAAIAIIIALKSLARFKELEDKNFAEYFLIGSLLSICIAIIPAFLIQWLF